MLLVIDQKDLIVFHYDRSGDRERNSRLSGNPCPVAYAKTWVGGRHGDSGARIVEVAEMRLIT